MSRYVAHIFRTIAINANNRQEAERLALKRSGLEHAGFFAHAELSQDAEEVELPS
jgi:hypothetical protein